MGDATKNFSFSEFACKCGTCAYWEGNSINRDLIEKIQLIRDAYGEPMPITSGIRCEKHNHNVGGRSRSKHLPSMGCRAADIGVGISRPKARILIVSHALALGLSVGLNDSFIHLDNRPPIDQRLFTY